MNSNKHLYRYLTEKIKKSGKLQFSEFMNETLYNVNLGYYTNKEKIFGREGDFVTTPVISSLFGECLSEEFINISHSLKEPSILEFGGGDASLLISMLKKLQKHFFYNSLYLLQMD